MPPKPSSGGASYNPHTSWRAANRLSTSASLKSNDIWSKTIGYDPYAAEGESEAAAAKAASTERARGILELARLSNAGQAARGTDFSQSLFWGLKRKAPPPGWDAGAGGDSDEDSSSDSDDEEEDEEEDRAAKRRRASSSGDEGGEAEREKGKKEKKKKEKKKKEKKKHHHKEKKAKEEKKKKKKKKER